MKTVTVTEEDIYNAMHNPINFRSRSCPIARAACRAFGVELGRIAVAPWGLFVVDARGIILTRHALPKEATDFINKFDTDGKVTAFEFNVEGE